MATVRVEIATSHPNVSSNAYPYLLDLSNNDQLLPAFAADLAGTWWGRVTVPGDFVGSAKVYLHLIANATTGVTRMQVGTGVAASGETWNATITDETAIDITVPGTAYLIKEQVFPSSGNISTTVAAGDRLFIRVQHLGTHANDTLAVDTILAGMFFEYSNS